MSHSPKPKKKKKFKRINKQKIHRNRVLRAKSQIQQLQTLLFSTDDIELKRAYIKNIRAIAQKFQYSLPLSIKYSFCRRCSEIFTFTPEKTFTVRIRSKPVPRIIFTCLKCDFIKRKPYSIKDKLKDNGNSPL